MCPFSVTVQNVPDRELGPLLTRLAQAGFDKPIISHLGADGGAEREDAPAPAQRADLPQDWRLLRERDGESYRWPDGRDRYNPYRVFIGTTRSEGAVPQQPLVEFLAADDYDETRELVAVIRGSDGGRRMYGSADTLPAVYSEHFRTQIYSDRVVHRGAWNKVVVVAREDDEETILNHALIQSRRRYRP
jgi:hypothetical protein